MIAPQPTARRRPIPARLGLLTALSIALGSSATASDRDGQGGVRSDPTFTALRVDGKAVAGRLRQLDVDGGVSLADDDEKLSTIPAASLVKLTREGSILPDVASLKGIALLGDGDRLYLKEEVGPAGESTIEVQSSRLETLALPLDGLVGLILAPPQGESIFALESRVRAEPRASEVLWLANGDRIDGGLLGLDEKKVSFRTAGGRVDLDRSGVIALGFDPKLVSYPRPPGLYYELKLNDGSRLGATTVHVEAGQVHAMTRFRQAIKLPISELAEVHSRGGRVVYLSDREPTREKTVSYIGPTRASRRNQAVDGQPLRLGGRPYDEGIGTQSRSLLAYRLEPGVTRFQATVGVDDRAGPLASVVFRVLVDGLERFGSGRPMSVGQPPESIDLDLKGAQTLILVTDFGERGEVRDHADWVEARLIR